MTNVFDRMSFTHRQRKWGRKTVDKNSNIIYGIIRE